MDIDAELKKFQPVPIVLPELTDDVKNVLRDLITAAKVMDDLFLDQVYEKNRALRQQLLEERREKELELFTLYAGPFSRLDHHKPFIEGHEKPAGAHFYPSDMTKEEFLKHIEEHPEDKDAFEHVATLIRRESDLLIAVPYSQAYNEQLNIAAQHLLSASQATDNARLAHYLKLRAEALLSNDYYESDIAWLDLDGDIDMVIGPYEVYEDELFGLKASFEAFIGLRDHALSQELSAVNAHLDEMERALPIDDKHKNFERGSCSPIIVVNEVFCAGDGKAGVQFTAFNLPNDERVRNAKGSKKVLLKNVAEAKYTACWEPIIERVLDEGAREKVSFDAYFTHVLLHEVSHGLGPGYIECKGTKMTVSQALKETYPTIEEAKADVLGVLNAAFLVEKGLYTQELLEQIVTTFVGGIFRSVRFGITEAHAAANVIVLNKLLDAGAVSAKDGVFSLDVAASLAEIKKITAEVLLIEAEGDYESAMKMIADFREIRPELAKALAKLSDVPVDIRPVFSDV